MIELTTEPIDYHQLTESVRDHAAGAGNRAADHRRQGLDWSGCAVWG